MIIADKLRAKKLITGTCEHIAQHGAYKYPEATTHMVLFNYSVDIMQEESRTQARKSKHTISTPFSIFPSKLRP